MPQGDRAAFDADPSSQRNLQATVALYGDPALAKAGGAFPAEQIDEKKTTLMRNLESAGIQPGSKEWRTAMLTGIFRPSNSVTVNNQQMPDPPKGYLWNDPADPKAGVSPIPGSPQEGESKDAQSAAFERLRQSAQSSSSVLAEIDEAVGRVPETGGPIGRWAIEKIPIADLGSKARALRGNMETIKSNVFQDILQSMREASKTGGAVGQVAVQEMEALKASLGSLDPGLDDATLLANFDKVRQYYLDWQTAVQSAYDARYSFRRVDAPPEIIPNSSPGQSGVRRRVFNPATGKLE
jgi:hypothetical protein